MDIFYKLNFLKYKHEIEVNVTRDLGLLKCDAVSLGEWFLTFWKIVAPSSDSQMSQTTHPM